jgi:hypothetical protein
MELRVTVSVGFTAAEICELVFEYQGLEHGSKGRWLAERGLNRVRMGRWRASLFDGDLDRGLVPRQGGAVGRSGAEHTAIARRRVAEQVAQAAEVERLNARIRELEHANGALEQANGALGKAIGLLRDTNEHEPDACPRMSDPDDSSPSKTDSLPS